MILLHILSAVQMFHRALGGFILKNLKFLHAAPATKRSFPVSASRVELLGFGLAGSGDDGVGLRLLSSIRARDLASIVANSGTTVRLAGGIGRAALTCTADSRSHSFGSSADELSFNLLRLAALALAGAAVSSSASSKGDDDAPLTAVAVASSKVSHASATVEHELEVAAYSGETLDIQFAGGSIRILGVPGATTVRLRATGPAARRASPDSEPASETGASSCPVEMTRSGSTVSIRRTDTGFKEKTQTQTQTIESDETHADLPWPLQFILWLFGLLGVPITVSVAWSDCRYEGRSHPPLHVEVQVPPRFNAHIGATGADLAVASLTGSISVDAQGGDVAMADVDGGINCAATGGSVQLRDITGRLTLHVVGGGVQLNHCQVDGEVSTTGGGIQARGVSGDLHAHAVGGNVDLRDVSGGVTGSAVGGNVVLTQRS